MSNPTTFGTLDQLLRRLGFVPESVSGSHIAYEHRPSGTILMFRDYKVEDPVSWWDLAMTRRFLLDRGLIEEETL